MPPHALKKEAWNGQPAGRTEGMEGPSRNNSPIVDGRPAAPPPNVEPNAEEKEEEESFAPMAGSQAQ